MVHVISEHGGVQVHQAQPKPQPQIGPEHLLRGKLDVFPCFWVGSFNGTRFGGIVGKQQMYENTT